MPLASSVEPWPTPELPSVGSPPTGGPVLSVSWALFDLDGCLVDSTRAIPACINAGLEAVGLPTHDEAALRWCIGPPLAGTFTRLLTDGGHRDVDAGVVLALDTYRAAYPTLGTELTRVIDGIEDVLAVAPQRRAVVTSKPRVTAVPLVAAMGLADHFEVVHGPGPNIENEPKTVTLGHAMDQLAITDPATAAMIGDRHHDVEAGRAHGTHTIGVTWGAGDVEELQGAGADHVVGTPSSLAALLTTMAA